MRIQEHAIEAGLVKVGELPRGYLPITKDKQQVLVYSVGMSSQVKLGITLSVYRGSAVRVKVPQSASAKTGSRTAKEPPQSRRMRCTRPFPGPLTNDLCTMIHVATLEPAGLNEFRSTCFSKVDIIDPVDTVILFYTCKENLKHWIFKKYDCKPSDVTQCHAHIHTLAHTYIYVLLCVETWNTHEYPISLRKLKTLLYACSKSHLDCVCVWVMCIRFFYMKLDSYSIAHFFATRLENKHLYIYVLFCKYFCKQITDCMHWSTRSCP